MGRGVYGVERLNAFTDAILSIVATILVLPLKVESEDAEGDASLMSVLKDKNTFSNILLFVDTFGYCALFWRSHKVLHRSDSTISPLMVYLNWTFLFFLSLVPFTNRLVGQAPLQELPRSISYGLLAVIAAWRIGMSLYAKHALGWKLAAVPGQLFRSIGLFVSSAAAAGIAWWRVDMCGTMLALYGLSIWVVTSKRMQRWFPCLIPLGIVPPPDPGSKERTTTLSDGIYAVAATLIVLDIPVPREGLSNSGVAEWLGDHSTPFLAYLMCSFTLCLLWINHYAIFHYADVSGGGAYMLNLIHLLFVALMPFTSNVLIVFLGDDESNARTAVWMFVFLVGCAALCLVGIVYLSLRKANNPTTAATESTSLLAPDSYVEEGGEGGEEGGEGGEEVVLDPSRLKRLLVHACVLPIALVLGGVVGSTVDPYAFLVSIPLAGWISFGISFLPWMSRGRPDPIVSTVN